LAASAEGMDGESHLLKKKSKKKERSAAGRREDSETKEGCQ